MKKYQIHEKQEFLNVRDLVERAAVMYSDNIAYSFKENPHDKEIKKISFTALRDDIRALSSELLSRGYAGKHCAVIGKFSYSWVRVYFSLLSIGAVIVPLDRDWLAADLAETAARADVEYLFIDADLAEKADAIRAGGSIKETVYMSASEGDTVETL